jgi:hypothetical protein
VTSFEKPSEFAVALRKAMTESQDIEVLFAVWEQNVEIVRTLSRILKQTTCEIRYRAAASRASQALRRRAG